MVRERGREGGMKEMKRDNILKFELKKKGKNEREKNEKRKN